MRHTHVITDQAVPSVEVKHKMETHTPFSLKPESRLNFIYAFKTSHEMKDQRHFLFRRPSIQIK